MEETAMKKKYYIKPTLNVVQLQHKCHMLSNSLQDADTNLDDWNSDGYEEKGGNQEEAW